MKLCEVVYIYVSKTFLSKITIFKTIVDIQRNVKVSRLKVYIYIYI